jgi:N,N'-diacetyllegionaminate synthase
VSTIQIADRTVGGGNRPLVIAEVAQAHDGSLGYAHAFVDLAADCGADAIKFQTHIARAESTEEEPFRVPFSYEDESRFDYWQRMEFTSEGWAGLATHARDRGLLFLSSAFSEEAVDLLAGLDMPAWKLASGEVSNQALLRKLTATGKPVLVSSGLSGFGSLDRTVAALREKNAPFALLQCTTKYPTPFEEVGLNVLDELRDRYDAPVGLSDHSASVFPPLAALARGADLVEVHLRLHSGQFGPDTVASLDPEKLAELCSGRDAIHSMLTNPVDKEALERDLSQSAEIFGRSLALRDDLTTGTVLERDMLVPKKPGGGIAVERLDELVGRRLAQDVPATRLLREDDLA